MPHLTLRLKKTLPYIEKTSIKSNIHKHQCFSLFLLLSTNVSLTLWEERLLVVTLTSKRAAARKIISSCVHSLLVKLCASVCVYFGAFVYLCISVFVYLPRSASEWERGVLGKRTLSLSSDLLPLLSYLPISLLTKSTGNLLYWYSHFCIQDISKKVVFCLCFSVSKSV